MADEIDDKDAPERDLPEPKGPTPLAVRLDRLKRASFDAARTRAKLPQPLFWSLFHSEIKECRREKERERVLRDLFDDGPGE